MSSPDWKLTLVPNHQVSLQRPTTKYPCSAQPMSIPAMLNGCAQPQSILAVPNRRVSCSAEPQNILAVPIRRISLHCRTAEYPCSAQPMSIPAVPNHQVSLQCPTEEYPCSVQPLSIPAGPNRKVSLQCPSAQYPWSAQQQSINIPAAHLQCCKEDN